MNRIILAYTPENAALAHAVDRQLSRIGIPFEHAHGALAAQIASAGEPVLLLVTDNLLKSHACMEGLLPVLQALVAEGRLVAVTADGLSAEGLPVPTQIDRMANALHYMKHWQDAWLALSDRHQHLEGADKAGLTAELDATRGIANQVGDLISTLREAGYLTWQEFEANDFEAFFQKFNLQDWHGQYKRLVAQAAESQTLAELPHLPEMPVAGGLLAPEPMPEPEAVVALPSEKVGAPAFGAMDNLKLEMEAEEHATQVEFPEGQQKDSPSEGEETVLDTWAISNQKSEISNQQSAINNQAEVEQAVRDAWFWIEKGHAERGLELFQSALEQYPESDWLQAEYERATQESNLQIPEPNLQTSEPSNLQTSEPSNPQTPEPQNPSDETKSYDLMGDMAAARGDYLFAKYCWDRVAETDPAFPSIYRKLGLMTAEHLRDYRETAVIYLRKALETNARDPAVMAALEQLEEAEAVGSGSRQEAGAEAVGSGSRQEAGAEAVDSGSRQEAGAEAVGSGSRQEAEAVDSRQEAGAEAVGSGTGSQQETQRSDNQQSTISNQQSTISNQQSTISNQQSTISNQQSTISNQESPINNQQSPLVLITGATSGIGRATAEVFARNGYRLILTGRRVERLVELKNRFEADFGSEVLLLPFDVRDAGAVEAALSNLPESYQEIDILVNNAGLAKGLAPIHEGELEHWEAMIDTNVKGLLYVTRLVSPGMVRRRRGHIINVGSSAGKEAYPNGNVYCATKFAVDALTKSMRFDLHAHNIRVSQVSPGHVEETEFALTRFDGDAERAKIYRDFQPLKPTDVADAIFFMATRPPHVNIQDLQLFATQQASSMVIDRSGR